MQNEARTLERVERALAYFPAVLIEIVKIPLQNTYFRVLYSLKNLSNAVNFH